MIDSYSSYALSVLGVHRRTEAPHNIQGLVIGRRIFEPSYELSIRHNSCHCRYLLM